MHNLIIQTAFIGDLFLSIPLIRKTRELTPEGQPLALVCRRGLGAFFKSQGLVDEVFEVDKSDSQSYKNVKAALSKLDLNYVICPHQSFRSAWLVSGLKAKVKIGFERPWNFWAFDRRVPRPMHLPDALRQIALLTEVSDSFAKDFHKVEQNTLIHNPEVQHTFDLSVMAMPEWAKMSLESKDRVTPKNKVFLAPGSVWATKRWTEDGFAETGQALVQQGFDVAFIGSAQEYDLCERLRERIPGSQNLAGKSSLEESIALLRTGRALISNDSGAMHLAAVANVPVVAVFGPTTLDLGYRPWVQRAVVVQKTLPCRPCGKHGSHQCPLGTHECMKSVTAKEVTSALNQVL